MSKKLQEILDKNKEFEKETPYNFCDRWCERCIHEKQIHCKVYHDELEQKITCIAHGKEPGDPEITAEVMKKQFEEIEKSFEEHEEEIEINFDEIDNPEFEKIKEHIKFVENNPLQHTAEQYCKKAHSFLNRTYYEKEAIAFGHQHDFETLSWYHTLLPAKINRALAGFHEPMAEGDFALYDAVSQFGICKKAINESIKAWGRLKPYYLDYRKLIFELLALLHNISSRIKLMEDEI